MQHIMKTMFAGMLILATVGASPVASAQSVVKVESGSLRGVNGAEVDRFLGIPYAQAPVGPLRWRDPLPAEKWNAMRDASRASAACYQAAPAAFGPYTGEFLNGPDVSEDCLYLNVWRPHGDNGKLPVYVFIHGGAFNSGSGNIPIYDGASLAQQGIVVVNINYRLGVFGFMAHPDLSRESTHNGSGNYGMLDQVAALRWVRANIAAFGGDPAAMAIGGQSAGAVSVNDLIVSPLAKGLFRSAIAESGAGGKTFGAFHTSEMPYVMGVLDAPGRAFTAADRAVSRAMQDRWIALIKTGNPGHGWAPANAAPVVMGLGDTIGPRQAVSTPERFKAFSDFAAAGGKLSLF